MTLQELQTKANAKLADFWTALQTKQDAYFAKHGKYFQLLITSKVVDGADTTFQVLHPSDEQNLADADFTFASPIPFQIEVSEWVGHDVGYFVTATVELLNGRRFRRFRNSLNEDTGWYEVLGLEYI